jgi:S1-C subfamily serine protease
MDDLFDALDGAGGATLTLAVVRGTKERELGVDLSDRG